MYTLSTLNARTDYEVSFKKSWNLWTLISVPWDLYCCMIYRFTFDSMNQFKHSYVHRWNYSLIGRAQVSDWNYSFIGRFQVSEWDYRLMLHTDNIAQYHSKLNLCESQGKWMYQTHTSNLHDTEIQIRFSYFDISISRENDKFHDIHVQKSNIFRIHKKDFIHSYD